MKLSLSLSSLFYTLFTSFFEICVVFNWRWGTCPMHLYSFTILNPPYWQQNYMKFLRVHHSSLLLDFPKKMGIKCGFFFNHWKEVMAETHVIELGIILYLHRKKWFHHPAGQTGARSFLRQNDRRLLALPKKWNDKKVMHKKIKSDIVIKFPLFHNDAKTTEVVWVPCRIMKLKLMQLSWWF